MNKILITGSSGFIGRNLVKFLSDNIISDDYEIILSDIIYYKHDKDYKFYLCDIRYSTHIENIFMRESNIKIVIHLASLTGVRKSIEFPKLYEEVNVLGMINLLEVCVKKYKVEKFIFASSSSVYGDNKDFTPNSVYGYTKLFMEKYAELYSKMYNSTNFIALRFFTVYGPYGRKDMSPYIFLKSMIEDVEITIFDKEASRDFTYVDDICSGIYECVYKNFYEGYITLDIGSNKSYSILEFIEVCKRVTGNNNPRIKFSRNKNEYEMRSTLANIDNTKKYINYSPSMELYEGMVKMYESINKY